MESSASADKITLPSAPGTYMLVLELSRASEIEVGKRWYDFPAGFYLYVGSAFGPGGLKSRVRRHLTAAKKKRWHIDYFREHAGVSEVWYTTARRLECSWSRCLSSLGANTPAVGFGASDCKCTTHLYHFHTKPTSNDVYPPIGIVSRIERS